MAGAAELNPAIFGFRARNSHINISQYTQVPNLPILEPCGIISINKNQLNSKEADRYAIEGTTIEVVSGEVVSGTFLVKPYLI